MRTKAYITPLLFLVSFGALNTQAAEIENQIIDKVINSYGGKTLLDLGSIKITDHNKNLWPGESEQPGQPEFWRFNEELTIDFEGKRKRLLSWRVSRTAKDLDLFIYDGKQARIYDLLNNKYSQDNWYNYENLGRSVVRNSDTMIAKSLDKQRNLAQYLGDTYYRGQLHQKLKTKLSDGQDYSLYIHKQSGHINRMERVSSRVGKISYLFSDHQSIQGIKYARDLNYFVGGQPRMLSVFRQIEPEIEIKQAFSKPVGFSHWGESFDTSKLSINKLADNSYQVGKGRSHTLFFDAGDYFIAAGGKTDLKQNYQALQQFTGSNKPLAYVVITHHHKNLLGLAKEALDLGAKVISTEKHLPLLKNKHPQLKDTDLVLVKDKLSLAKGQVQILDIASAHARHHLNVYIPQAKLLFSEHMYDTRLKTALPRVHQDMADFVHRINKLELDIEYFISSASPRLLTLEDLLKAVAPFKTITCPTGYSLCANG